MTFRRRLGPWQIILSPRRELDFHGFPSLRNTTRGFDNFEKSCSRISQSMIFQGPRCSRSSPVSFRRAFKELREHFAIKFNGQIAKVRSDAASRRLNRAPRSLKIELSRRREHDSRGLRPLPPTPRKRDRDTANLTMRQTECALSTALSTASFSNLV